MILHRIQTRRWSEFSRKKVFRLCVCACTWIAGQTHAQSLTVTKTILVRVWSGQSGAHLKLFVLLDEAVGLGRRRAFAVTGGQVSLLLLQVFQLALHLLRSADVLIALLLQPFTLAFLFLSDGGWKNQEKFNSSFLICHPLRTFTFHLFFFAFFRLDWWRRYPTLRHARRRWTSDSESRRWWRVRRRSLKIITVVVITHLSHWTELGHSWSSWNVISICVVLSLLLLLLLLHIVVVVVDIIVPGRRVTSGSSISIEATSPIILPRSGARAAVVEPVEVSLPAKAIRGSSIKPTNNN